MKLQQGTFIFLLLVASSLPTLGQDGTHGRECVIAVLLQQGKATSTLPEIRVRMPKTEGNEQALPAIRPNAVALLSQDMYDTHAASLTKPPCSAGMTWFVLKTPADISTERIDIFARPYPNNARPVQPIGTRFVKVGQQ